MTVVRPGEMNVAGPAHLRIVQSVCAHWPEHRQALGRVLPDDPRIRSTAEQVSATILELVGADLDRYVAGYRWLCEMVLEEEIEFRRTGHYRYATFAEVEPLVYAKPAVMVRYVDGMLLSQVLWANHLSMLDYYLTAFIPAIAGSAAHLEVGPGHGLLLWLAARGLKGTVSGWDVSATSLDRTRQVLRHLGAGSVDLVLRNLFDAPEDRQRFDSVVISEVLEHLEQPALALRALHARMNRGALLFVQAPVNAPTVDHIWLFNTPEEVVELVASTGFAIESTRFAPATGLTEERARKRRFAISCGVIARKIA